MMRRASEMPTRSKCALRTLVTFSIVSLITFQFGGIFLPRASFPKQLYSTLYACFGALPEPKTCSQNWKVINDTVLNRKDFIQLHRAGLFVLAKT